MAQSTKGTGNFLFPLAVVAAAVVVAIAVTFTIGQEEPPAEPTIVGDAEPDQRPAGAGTVPEGAADEEIDGISEQVDDVEPAAPGEDEVPAADAVPDAAEDDAATEGAIVSGGADPATAEEEPTADPAAGEGEKAVTEQVPAPAEGDDAGSDDATAPADTEAPADGEEGTGTTETGNESDDSAGFVPEGDASDTAVQTPEEEGFPAGRDAETELSPEPGQDVVEDDDEGGTAFVPTPSGPEGRDLDEEN